MRRYYSSHTGKELDEAIRKVIDAGLDNLMHDRGMYTSVEELPEDAKDGDYAYVGITYEDMWLYSRVGGQWRNVETSVDLSQKATATITQETGESTSAVMSQKAVTREVELLAVKEANNGTSIERLQALLGDLSNKVAEIKVTLQQLADEEGFCVTDSDGNVGLRYDESGLDAALLSEHFVSLVKEIKGIGLAIGTIDGTAYEGSKGQKLAEQVSGVAAQIANLKKEVSQIGASLQTIDGNEFCVTDADGNVGLKYDESGLDAALLSEHFVSLIKEIEGIGLLIGTSDGTAYEGSKGQKLENRVTQIEQKADNGFVQVDEDGFFVTDSNGFVAFSVTEDGANWAQTQSGLLYDIIEIN